MDTLKSGGCEITFESTGQRNNVFCAWKSMTGFDGGIQKREHRPRGA